MQMRNHKNIEPIQHIGVYFMRNQTLPRGSVAPVTPASEPTNQLPAVEPYRFDPVDSRFCESAGYDSEALVEAYIASWNDGGPYS